VTARSRAALRARRCELDAGRGGGANARVTRIEACADAPAGDLQVLNLAVGLEGAPQAVVVDAGNEEVRILRLEPEELVAHGAADEIGVEPEAADEVLDCAIHVLRQRDGLDLDERAGRKPGHLDGRAGRRLVAHVLLVHLVHRREVVEVLQEHRRLDEPVETRARRLEDRAEVRQHQLGLVGDVVADDLGVIGLSASCPETKTKPFALIACEYGAPWNGAGADSVRMTSFMPPPFCAA
jgi:hypothetical protein